jgi:hypothetical protein
VKTVENFMAYLRWVNRTPELDNTHIQNVRASVLRHATRELIRMNMCSKPKTVREFILSE